MSREPAKIPIRWPPHISWFCGSFPARTQFLRLGTWSGCAGDSPILVPLKPACILASAYMYKRLTKETLVTGTTSSCLSMLSTLCIRCFSLLVVLMFSSLLLCAQQDRSIKSSEIKGLLTGTGEVVQISLRDGSSLKGRVRSVGELNMNVSVEKDVGGHRVSSALTHVQYRDIKEISIWLKASRTARTVGALLGVGIGYVAGAGLTGISTNSGPTTFGVAVLGAAAGGLTGAWLGGRHTRRVNLHIIDE